MRAAVRLVWALDVRHLVVHRTRLALSAMGIAVGVALAVAVGSLGTSIKGSLNAIAQAAASDANVEIRANGRAGLPPEVLGRVRDVPGVRAAGATVESYVHIRRSATPKQSGGADLREQRVLALGFDLGILRMSPSSVDPSTLRTSDPFGLILPPAIASALGVRAGEEIEITTPDGWQHVKVGTVLPPDTAERTRLVVAPVGVLQRLLGRGSSYDAIYVQADDPTKRLAAIERAVGDVGRAGPIAFRSNQLQQLLAGATASFSVGTIVALFVGAFLVYNTMAMAAVERLREAALLRAVGATKRQVFALFLAEGGVLGLVGSALGVVGGLLLSRFLLFQSGSALEEIYPIQFTSLTVSPVVLAGAGIAGVVAALAAAFLPARRLARSDPAPALGPSGTLEDPTRKRRRATVVVALLCAAAGPVITVPAVQKGAEGSGVALAGMALTLTGLALLVPICVPLVAGALLGSLVRFRRTPSVARLASGEILRSPGRTSFTVGAVLLSLALVVGFSIAQTSFTRAFDTGFEDIIAADLYVRSATWRVFGSDVPLDDELSTQIEAIPGVATAWPFRFMPAELDGKPLLVIAYDTEKFGVHSRLRGEAKRAALEQARLLRVPNAVLATPSLLSQLGREVGDTLDVPTPTGTHRVRIAGTLDDPSAINPEIVFDHATFERVWGTGGADTFGVVATDRSDVDRVRAEIERRFGPRFGLAVDTRQEYFDLLAETVGSVTQLIGSVQLVAVVVAALGLANTLLISTFERRRDLGVLRAVGMQRKQLRRMVATEALLVGSIGVLLAWALGTVIGLAMFGFVRSQLGLDLQIAFPPSAYAGAAILGLSAALTASIYPANRAARLDVVAALQYE